MQNWFWVFSKLLFSCLAWRPWMRRVQVSCNSCVYPSLFRKENSATQACSSWSSWCELGCLWPPCDKLKYCSMLMLQIPLAISKNIKHYLEQLLCLGNCICPKIPSLKQNEIISRLQCLHWLALHGYKAR